MPIDDHTYTNYLPLQVAVSLGGGCSAPVGISTKLKQNDNVYKLTLTGAVWSLDGSTKLEETLDQKFEQIRKTVKHKLSPMEEASSKKIKTDKTVEADNEIAVLNRRITEKTGDLGCEDLAPNVADRRCFCGLTTNVNMPIDVVIKCDNLGRDLANSLIDKGALEVMKISQDIIRSSIGKKS